MDFPVCPQCHQSVIDDDAVDCPFCGASMKGKPGAKPSGTSPKPPATGSKPPVAGSKSPPAGTAKSPTTPEKSVPGKPTTPGARPPGRSIGKPAVPADDFPFELEVTSGKTAMQSSPVATKQRSLKVICPMCDTAGYVPPTAAGQDVRCANPKCVMPVFTAPDPNKKVVVAAPKPPPPPSKLPMMISMLVVAVGVAAGGYYFMFLMPPAKKELSPDALAELQQMARQNQTKPLGVDAPVNNPVVNEAAPVEAGVTNDQLMAQALQLLESTIYTGNRPFCRKMCAEAYVLTGDEKSARKHLEPSTDIWKNSSYFRIPPLVDLFWVDLKAGDAKGWKENLDLAMKEVSKIPQHGRMRFEIAGRLAAALVAADQPAEAKKLLESIRSENVDSADPQLAARLQFALDGRVYALSGSQTIFPWKFPQEVAVTASLINHGYSEKAIAWAAAQTDDDAKAECLGYWGEDLALHQVAEGAADADGKIAEAIKSLPPVLAARVWARAGYSRYLSNDAAGIASAIKQVNELLTQVGQPPAGPTMPDTKATIRFKLPDAAATLLRIRAAMAAGELAFLQAQSADSIADAERSLDLAMGFADALAPSYFMAAQAYHESEKMGPQGRQQMFKKLMGPKTKDDEARTMALNYQDAVVRIYKASQKRFHLETLLLSRLLSTGQPMASKVWIIVNGRASSTDSNKKEDFFKTDIPGELIEMLKGTPEADAIKGAWTQHHKEPAPPRPVAVEFEELIRANNVPAAVKRVEARSKSAESASVADEVFLRTAIKLASEDKFPLVYEFATRIGADVPKWESLRIGSEIAAQRGHAEEVLKLAAANAKGKQAGASNERAAMSRGVIAGLKSAEKPANSGLKPVVGTTANAGK